MTNRETNNSWNHLGVRSGDGMLVALPFRAWKHEPDWKSNTEAFRKDSTHRKQLSRVEWHTLNLKSGEISDTLSTMPPEVTPGGTAVVCGNRVYVLGGVCMGDPCCPDQNFLSFHHHNTVFYFDCESPVCEWKKAPATLFPRDNPSAFAIDGKIYVFGSVPPTRVCLAEVFDIHQNRWDLLPSPPVAPSDLLYLSDHVLFNSSRSRFLVHFHSNHSLYAFSPAPDGGSWECLDTEFWSWTSASVIVEDVAYFLFDPDSDWPTHLDSMIKFGAYHIVDKKWMPILWYSPLPVWYSRHLFHLGNGLICLAWHTQGNNAFNYLKFRVNFYDGKINAIAEPEISIKTVPFECYDVSITALNEGGLKKKKLQEEEAESEEKEIEGRRRRGRDGFKTDFKKRSK